MYCKYRETMSLLNQLYSTHYQFLEIQDHFNPFRSYKLVQYLIVRIRI